MITKLYIEPQLAREALLEQMVLVDALVNKSHDLLELLSLEKCQEQLDQPFLEVRMKFDRLNEQLNDKTNGIIQAWRESTTSVSISLFFRFVCLFVDRFIIYSEEPFCMLTLLFKKYACLLLELTFKLTDL